MTICNFFPQHNLELLARGLFSLEPTTDEAIEKGLHEEEIPSNLYLFQRFLRIVWLYRKEFDYMFEKKLVNIRLLENAAVHVYDFQEKLSCKEKYRKAAEIFALYWVKKQAIDKFLDCLHNVFVEECNRNIFFSTRSQENTNLFVINGRLSCLRNSKGNFFLRKLIRN